MPIEDYFETYDTYKVIVTPHGYAYVNYEGEMEGFYTKEYDFEDFVSYIGFRFGEVWYDLKEIKTAVEEYVAVRKPTSDPDNEWECREER